MSVPLATNVAVGQPQTPPATINNLPIEVLHEIVSLATLQEQADGYYDRLRSLRLVAALWSALIDDYPECWSIISSSDPELIWRMALQKSKAAMIDVESGSIHVSTDHQTMLVKEVVHHMPRVRKLAILDRDFEYLIASAPAAPRLRSLYLCGGVDNDHSITLPLHPALWAPNLRDVDLYCSRLTWKEPLWNSLELFRIDTGGWTQGLPMEGIFTVLQASPGLRILDLRGIIQRWPPSHRRTLPVVRLEALETLKFDTTIQNSPLEALDSIVALPTRCAVYFDAQDENLRLETLRSICKFAPRTANGDETGSLLKLSAGPCINRFTMGGLDIMLYSQAYDKLNPLVAFMHILERLPSEQRSAVTTVEISETNFAFALGSLPIVSSFCPNTSHLTIPALNSTISTAIGGTNNGWLFPNLESLSISRYRGRHHAVKVVQARLRASESGQHVAKLKKLTLSFFCKRNMDELELAKLDALLPELVVNHPNEQLERLFGSQLSSDSE
ncbi:hypothetical protein M407DRAFT_26726 [Tulasnella calospora MUT 4182]|uniref:F-box domain-containing protein n=1 Tax=Tulasnella calospora MUT 4182 TaxID=1051891 RepID=A0A0C3QDV8_9AGAM|nr:hypothetical protein M407DRAFT_26726 [Tulasnella calospora MUT 4182]